ncbi:hypothetical protein RIB2604_01200280 [Aspergillus luchuensis]|uniref:Uncharacterized protein n=2 Tax=Aspergillus kawachii TaxID=1069201 RepID=A0A146F7Z4_ASPKA|nr:hypothetical protein RIB2604_01200280 [Aspergillus luchuensis]
MVRQNWYDIVPHNRELRIVMPRQKPLAGVASFLSCHDQQNADLVLSLLKELAFVAETPVQNNLCHDRALHDRHNPQWSVGNRMLIPKSLVLGIQLILRGLSPGSLVKFTWCYPWLPRGIMNSNGYIPRFQPQIVSLELYTQAGDETGTGRSSIAEEISVDGLVQLRHLTCLVWHGICPRRHALVLDTCIRQNSGTLERLDLRFSRRAVDRTPSVARAHDRDPVEFPNLRMLTLENVPISESGVIASLLSHPSGVDPWDLNGHGLDQTMENRNLELIREIGWHRGKNRLYRACYGLFQELQEVLRTGIDELLDLYYWQPASLNGIQGLLDLYCSQACLPFKDTVELLCLFYLEPASDLSKCEGLLGPCASRPFALMGELLDYLRLFTSQPVPTSADVMQLVGRLAHPVPSLDTVERFLSRHCLQQFPSLRAVVQLLDLFYLQPGLSLAQAEEHLSRYSTQPSPPLGLLVEYLSELKSQQPCVSTADIAVRMLQHMRALGNRETEAEDAWNNLLRAS